VLKIMIIGGAPRSLVLFRGDLIKSWIKLGLSVVALSAPAREDIEREIRSIGADFKSVPLKRDSLNPLKDLGLIWKLCKIIKSEKPDMIFAYTVKPIIYSVLAAGKNSKIKYYFMVTGLGYAFTGISLKQRVVKMLLKYLYRVAFSRSEIVFFQNSDDLAVFEDLQIMPRKKRSLIVNGSGVDTGHFGFSEYKDENELSFLLIARLLKSKGIKEYVEAARIVKTKHHNSSFYLVGPFSAGPDGVSKTDLKAWQDEGIINYLGYQYDVRPYIKVAGVYVLPSYREGMPRSVLEAMSMGRPIITTDVPGCRDTVIDGVNGYLVPVKNSEALAEAMEKFILAPGLINRMGRKSRLIAEEKFDVQKINRIILEEMNLV